MPTLLMKEIYCPRCARPTRHLESSLRQAFVRLSASSRDSQQVSYACPECDHLGLTEIPGDGKWVQFPDDKQHPDDAVAFSIALECANSNCRSRAIVLAPMKRGTDVDQVKQRMRRWIDDGLKCPEGHPLLKPYQAGGIRTI